MHSDHRTAAISSIVPLVRTAMSIWMARREGLASGSDGMCVAVSLATCRALQVKGFKQAQVVRGRYMKTGHAWIVLDDLIIDPTFDQFGGPAILVTEASDPRYQEITDDPDFLQDMGPAGDHKLWTYLDADGEEDSLGTRAGAAEEILAIYHELDEPGQHDE